MIEKSYKRAAILSVNFFSSFGDELLQSPRVDPQALALCLPSQAEALATEIPYVNPNLN